MSPSGLVSEWALSPTLLTVGHIVARGSRNGCVVLDGIIWFWPAARCKPGNSPGSTRQLMHPATPCPLVQDGTIRPRPAGSFRRRSGRCYVLPLKLNDVALRFTQRVYDVLCTHTTLCITHLKITIL
jgi:hypothetical protein